MVEVFDKLITYYNFYSNYIKKIEFINDSTHVMTQIMILKIKTYLYNIAN